ncbi:hypothetical protein GCM10009564_05740 [Streptomyces thermogriseus]|uniref:Uncharacterized protein n=1 Tax=Streptomyces thermogriseus TaxID=75292 RepID=A0ABN1ST37_9ACTN
MGEGQGGPEGTGKDRKGGRGSGGRPVEGPVEAGRGSGREAGDGARGEPFRPGDHPSHAVDKTVVGMPWRKSNERPNVAVRD